MPLHLHNMSSWPWSSLFGKTLFLKVKKFVSRSGLDAEVNPPPSWRVLMAPLMVPRVCFSEMGCLLIAKPSWNCDPSRDMQWHFVTGCHYCLCLSPRSKSRTGVKFTNQSTFQFSVLLPLPRCCHAFRHYTVAVMYKASLFDHQKWFLFQSQQVISLTRTHFPPTNGGLVSYISCSGILPCRLRVRCLFLALPAWPESAA